MMMVFAVAVMMVGVDRQHLPLRASEQAAYHAMRKLAMERGQTIAKVARDVIDMARVLL